MPGEQACKLAATHAKALGKFLDRRYLFVESALLDDKPYRALDGCTASNPRVGKRRGLGTAPQTRPKPRRSRSRSGRKKLDVGRPCRAHGADGSTINAGGPDPGEKSTVVAGITRNARAIAFRKVHRHHGATYHAAATPQSAVRGWSPVPASNAPTPSLSLAERRHLGRDAIRRLRLMQTQIVDVGAASLECTVNGSGDPLVVLANAGCSTGYLERLGERIPGSQIIAINMRGVGASRGLLDNATLHDLAADVAGVLEALQCGPVHILGHAFGNRIARCLAADHPAMVRGVILVAAGGLIGPSTPLGSSFRDAP